MLLDRALQDVNHSGMAYDVRLIVQSPMEGIHQSIVRVVHRFVHPDGIGNVKTHRQAQLAATFKQGVHARIVRMHAKSIHGVRNEALSLVMEFTNPAGACLMAPF